MASAGDYGVVTPERVSLQYDIAGIGSRGAAILVDLMLQSLISLVLYIALIGIALGLTAFGGLGETGAFIVVLVLFIIAAFALTLGYNMAFEILWNGQTPGKRSVGIRVIRENGYPIRPIDGVIRNVVRIVDYLPFAYAIGVFAMLFNARAKRLGDFAAGTIVVHEGPVGALGLPTAVPTDDQPSTSLRPDDATLVRDFLMRRSELARDARADLALRLSTALAARYGLGLDADPETMLARLV